MRILPVLPHRTFKKTAYARIKQKYNVLKHTQRHRQTCSKNCRQLSEDILSYKEAIEILDKINEINTKNIDGKLIQDIAQEIIIIDLTNIQQLKEVIEKIKG